MVKTRSSGLFALSVSSAVLASHEAHATLPTLDLPDQVVAIDAGDLWLNEHYYSATISGSDADSDMPDGTYPGWCIEDNGSVFPPEATLYSSYGPMPADMQVYSDAGIPAAQGTVGDPIPWNKLNYLLNHRDHAYGRYSMYDTQAAIWMLIWGEVSSVGWTSSSEALYLDAEINGAGFVPQTGDLVAVILYADGLNSLEGNGGFIGYQDTVVEIPVPPQTAQRSSLGDRVWWDTNRDGLQTAGEAGVPNVPVTLLDCQGNALSRIFTDNQGYYRFSNLTAGCYAIAFSLPSGARFTGQDVGINDTIDSDANITTGTTRQIQLAAGVDELIWDAGLIELPASLGDYVWNDLNNNGIQDLGEPGIGGVQVTVLTADADGSCALGLGEVVAMTATNASGRYEATNLDAGLYCVEFELLPGFAFSSPSQGSDDTLDSNANSSTGRTDVITLDRGENDLRWDAGMHRPLSCDLGVEVLCQAPAPVSSAWVCSAAKPLDVISMIWKGAAAIDLRAWKSTVGSTLLAQLVNVQPGQEVRVSGYNGAPNDVFWEVFTANSGFVPSARIGQSTFHLSCSDVDMNGPEDCGKAAGDGKTVSSYINGWILDGMVGANGLALDCSPTPPPLSESCSVPPGTEVTFYYGVDNFGSPLTDVSLVDNILGQLAGPFSLATGESREFTATNKVYEDTVHEGTFIGEMENGESCQWSSESLVEVSFDDCNVCKGGVTELTLRYEGSSTGTLRIYEGTYVRSDKLLYSGVLGSAPFTFQGVRSDRTMSSEITVWINGKLHTTLHTSCSQPIGPNMQFGDFQVLSGNSKDNGLLCPIDTCHPSAATSLTVKDVEVSWVVANQGDLGLEINRIAMTWPTANGTLTEIKRDGDVVHKGDFPPPSTIITGGWDGTADKRTIKAGESDVLKFKFTQTAPASSTYSIEVGFTNGCKITIEYTGGGTTGSFDCSKPISSLSMIWNGSQPTVYVTAWKGAIGTTALTTLAPANLGSAFTVTGLAGSPNDIVWEIFSDSLGKVKLGASDFHVSCSDDDMDTADDCGKAAGDGKGLSGYLNSWKFAGMVDSDETLVCPMP